MVSQEVVQQAMEAIGKPCTTIDIEKHLREKGLMSGTWDLKTDIAGVLNLLRKWLVVDRLPDGHTVNRCSVWYLKNKGLDHDIRTCEKCKEIRILHSKHIGNFVFKSEERRMKKEDGPDE